MREKKQRGRECMHTRERAISVRERKERGSEGASEGASELVVHYTYVCIYTQGLE